MYGILSPACLVTMLWLAASSEPPQAQPVSRTVKENILTSTEKPAIKLKFDSALTYIGGQSFVLYGTAHAEQHFFVDADKDKKIRRFYWVQFEGYLPSNTHTYKYNSKTKAKLGHLEFFADANVRRQDGPPRPDSDSAKALTFLTEKGYQMASKEVMAQRLVHLLDDKKRDELMIIYGEVLTPMKLTAADLQPGGKAADQWEKISAELLKRSLDGMKLVAP